MVTEKLMNFWGGVGGSWCLAEAAAPHLSEPFWRFVVTVAAASIVQIAVAWINNRRQSGRMRTRREDRKEGK